MFSLVNKIHQEIKGLPHSATPTLQDKNTRLQIVKEVFEVFAKNLKISGIEQLEVVLDKNNPISGETSAAKLFGRVFIDVPSLLLLDIDDIPQDLRITNPSDPRLEDDKFVQKISDWISDRFEIPRAKISRLQKEGLKVYLKFIQNPETAKKAIKFIIKHELGHVANNHGEHYLRFYFKSIGVCLSFSIIATIILAFVLPVSVFSFLITVLVASNISSFALCKIGGIFIALQHEREADAFAIQNDRSAADGGIYYFELVKSHFKALRERTDLSLKERMLSKLYFSSDGDSRLDLYHPSESERIKTIKHMMNGSRSNLIPNLFGRAI